MNATTRAHFLRALAPVCVLLAAAPAAPAASFTVADAEGFDSANYSLGILEGQFGSTNGGFGSTPWVQSPIGGTSTAVVQDSVVASGDQAVRVDRAANSDDRWALPVTGFPAERYICIDWDMMVLQSSTTGFGPFFGIEAYDDDATSILRIGSLGVDAATSDVLVTDAAVGLIETGVTVNFGEWYSYRMILDYDTDTYFAFVDGALVYEGDFEFPGIDQFTDADIAAIAASFDPASQAATGTAYFDNYFVFETDLNKIPEPAAFALAMVAFAGLAAGRR